MARSPFLTTPKASVTLQSVLERSLITPRIPTPPSALGANTTGTFNVAIGGSALLNNTGGGSNTAIGVGALSQATGDDNTVLGRVAGFGITTGNNIIAI